MKIQTSKLTDLALDWAVATLEGYGGLRNNPHMFNQALIMNRKDGQCVLFSTLNYSTDWSQGGPLIERMRGLKLKIGRKPGAPCYAHVVTYNGVERWHQTGKTPLIAALRCYVTSKLGDEIDVPEELLK